MASEPFTLRAHQLCVDPKLQAALNLGKGSLNHLRAACGGHKRPLSSVMRILVGTFANGHIGRTTIFLANTLQALAFFLQRPTPSEQEIDLQNGNIHLRGRKVTAC